MDKFSSLSAAMFSSPSNYIEAKEKYERDLQAKINETWWLASDNYEIQEEKIRGTREFSPIVCRMTRAINPRTGLNLGDDFKQLIFFDLKSTITMGYRFIFDNSWWIVTNTNNYSSPTKSVIVRRCNNVIKYIYDGKLVEEPCIIDYATKYSNVYYNDVVNIPQGTIEVTCQNNVNSSRVKYNDRFIFGNDVYKVKTVKDYLREETFVDKSNPLVTFSMYVDVKSEHDDFENGIADTDSYNINDVSTTKVNETEIVITPMQNALILNEKARYNCVLFKNGVQTNSVFEFIPSGVPDGYYELEVLDGNNFTIRNIKPYFRHKLIIHCQVINEEIYKDVEISLKGLY